MRRATNIVVLLLLILPGFAQEETHIVDSLESILPSQQGREKVLTMIELTWEFYDISFDDGIRWGEKAIQEAQILGYDDLEAKANYALGIQYAYHADLDLAKMYLKKSYQMFMDLSDAQNAFESLWNIATYELNFGSMDTARQVYSEALSLAEQMNDSVSAVYVLSNLAVIHHQKNELGKVAETYLKVKRLSEKLGMERISWNAENNLATLYVESGEPVKAKEMLLGLIPKLETHEDNYYLVMAYKTLGTVYGDYYFNYDSAMYCFEKSLHHADSPIPLLPDEISARMYKSDVLSDMGNVGFQRHDYAMALKKYKEALQLAEAESYLSGQMRACYGLGMVYAHLGQAANSMEWLDKLFELEERSGITMMRPGINKLMILNYARLGRYEEMTEELDALDEQKLALQRENNDLYDQLGTLQDDATGLLQQYEAQNVQIKTFQTQRNRYRLAFFGLLAIALAAAILLVAYKIIRKNQVKNEKV
jgi:tetratricopeptide (TPR) repeat protein